MRRWDGSAWSELTGCVVDTNAHTVTCQTPHFSIFALVAQTASVNNVVATPTPTATPTATPTPTPAAVSPQLASTGTDARTIIVFADLLLIILAFKHCQKVRASSL